MNTFSLVRMNSSVNINFDFVNVIGLAANGLCIFVPSAVDPGFQQNGLADIRIGRGAFIWQENYYHTLLVASDVELCTPARNLPPQKTRDVLHKKTYVALSNFDYGLIKEDKHCLSVTITREDRFRPPRLTCQQPPLVLQLRYK